MNITTTTKKTRVAWNHFYGKWLNYGLSNQRLNISKNIKQPNTFRIGTFKKWNIKQHLWYYINLVYKYMHKIHRTLIPKILNVQLNFG